MTHTGRRPTPRKGGPRGYARSAIVLGMYGYRMRSAARRLTLARKAAQAIDAGEPARARVRGGHPCRPPRASRFKEAGRQERRRARPGAAGCERPRVHREDGAPEHRERRRGGGPTFRRQGRSLATGRSPLAVPAVESVTVAPAENAGARAARLGGRAAAPPTPRTSAADGEEGRALSRGPSRGASRARPRARRGRGPPRSARPARRGSPRRPGARRPPAGSPCERR